MWMAAEGHTSGSGPGLAIAKQAILTNGGTMIASKVELHGSPVAIDPPLYLRAPPGSLFGGMSNAESELP
jgi:signal transduction histidine kinase